MSSLSILPVAPEEEEETAARCIDIIVGHVVSFHDRGEDSSIEIVLACDLEQLDTALLVALAHALKA